MLEFMIGNRHRDEIMKALPGQGMLFYVKGLIGQVKQILAITAFQKGLGHPVKLFPVDKFHPVSDLLNAADLQSLPVLYHFDKLGGLQ